ncbi:MAG: sensor histidine kinase [Treponemataceae bacterium]
MKNEPPTVFSRLFETYLTYRKSTLERKIFSYFFLFSGSFILVGALVVILVFFNAYSKTEEDHARNSSNKAKQNIEFILSLINNTGSQLATNPELLKTLSAPVDNALFDAAAETDRMNLMLKNIISVQEAIKNIYIVGRNGVYYSSYWDESRENIENRFGGILNYTMTRREYLNGGPYVSFHPFFDLNVISFTRPIYNYSQEESLGAIVIDLNYTYLREIFTFSSLQQDAEKVIVVNTKGDVLFSFPFNTALDHVIKENPSLLAANGAHLTAKVFGRECILISDGIASSDWKIVRILDKSDIYVNIRRMAAIGMSIWALFVLIAVIVSFFLSSSITRPIIELHNSVKKVEQGDLSIRTQVFDKDEIGQLAESFNGMIDQISGLLTKTLEEQKRKSDLEFQILQSQINPHFLYNTLDSIKWLAVFQGVENIGEMAGSLINLLKYNISRKSTLVNLEDEVSSIRDYIEIQKFRFGDAFRVEYQISEDTKHCQVLKFILQPLVENAIFHGFSNLDKEGIITIRSARRDGKLFIEVIDNGRGMDYEQIMNGAPGPFDKRKINNGIGVSNVIERIKLYFGDQGSFNIRNVSSGGVSVEILIPLLEGPKFQAVRGSVAEE